MADNTKIWPIFRWANWGLSDDLFTGIKNSFYYSDNIEIRQNSKAIYPCYRPNYQSQTVNGMPVCMLYHNAYWYIFTDEWKIYKTLVYDETTELSPNVDFWKIYDAELFWDYFYFTTDKWLFQISKNAPDSDWNNIDTTSPLLALNSWYWYYPLLTTSTQLVVGNGNEIMKVTREIQTTAQSWFTLPDWYEVRFIDELWAYTRITADDWFYWTEIELWDWVSSARTEVIPLAWYHIFGSIIFQWYHYLLSDKWLWLLNWYQFYTLKKIRISNQYVNNNMCVHDEKLYIVLPWSDWTTSWVYVYWAKNKNYNDVLAQQWSWRYWCIFSSWRTLILARGLTSPVWYYELWELENNVPWIWAWNNKDWELWTMAYFGNSLSEIKQAMYLRVWYEIASWWNIKVYYRTEVDWYWLNPSETVTWHELTQPWWLTNESDMRSPFATSLKLNCRFQRIQFKFVLTQWNTNSFKTRTTYLYSADLYYNDMLD